MAYRKKGVVAGRKGDKLVREALLLELCREIDDPRHKGEKIKRLRVGVRAAIAKMEAGDMTAFKEIADRIDGRVPQGIEGPGEEGEFNHCINVVFVKPNGHANGGGK